ncbi:DUF3592 domain-containing protein [Streptomyces uncialis]|uniref:DUF3592 domain-containing protein n=1 Tax=Streptomyces uncialis TaxID=1048205 RepID=UPI00381623CE
MTDSTGAELLSAHRKAVARIDGDHLLVERSGTRWTIPPEALKDITERKHRKVRVELTGDPARAPQGLGLAVVLPTYNAHHVDHVVQRLRALAATVPAAPDGHALITVEPCPRGPGRFLGPDFRRQQWIFGSVAAWIVALLVWIALADDPGAVAALASLLSWLVPTALAVLHRAVYTRVRPALILRSRGVTVPGVTTGSRRMNDESRQEYPFLRFTTLDGLEFDRVRSLVSVFERAQIRQPAGIPVDVTYDPRNPLLASRPATFSHTLVTVLMLATAGASLWYGGLITVTVLSR